MPQAPLADWQAVNNHAAAIVEYLQSKLPKAIKVQTHGGRFGERDLKDVSVKAPALLVSVLRQRLVKTNSRLRAGALASAGVDITVELTIGITIVTKDLPGLKRDQAATNLAQFLVVSLPNQTFGNDGAQPVPSEVDARNLFDAEIDKAQHVALWGCAFKQQLTFFAELEPENIPAHLFLGEAPEIGAAYQDGYQKLA